jgi:hypothetical protein
MSTPIIVQIVGAPVACTTGVKDTWREVARLAQTQFQHRFGAKVQVAYFDLFDPACPPVPPKAQLPLVIIEGQLFSSGGKISLPAIRKQVERLDTAQK